MELLFVGFIVGAVLGSHFGRYWGYATDEAMKARHKKEMDEIFEEVKRLRAQVANLIGKE